MIKHKPIILLNVGSIIWFGQPAHNIQRTSPEGPLKVLTSGTYRRLSGDSKETKRKTDDLMMKFYFKSNSFYITCLFLFFLREEQLFKSSKWGHPRGNPFAGCPGDRMTGCSRDVWGTSVNHFLKFNSQTH